MNELEKQKNEIFERIYVNSVKVENFHFRNIYSHSVMVKSRTLWQWYPHFKLVMFQIGVKLFTFHCFYREKLEHLLCSASNESSQPTG